MTTLFGGTLHAGLSGLELHEESIDLGHGLTISRATAHLMAPFIVATQPAVAGSHHPGPWKAARGGSGFDVNAELLVPADFEERFGSKIIVVRAVLFLLRLAVNPAITLPVFSNYAFSNLAQVSDDEAHFFPYEVYPRHFPLGVTGGITTQDALEWLASHWQVAVRLFDQSAEFLVAAEAIDSGQFVRESRLTLVSIWGALEALFSPSTSELKFRVSALIAAYLEPPGSGRHGLQRQVAKMYDKRSAAAHGKPKHDPDDLLAAFNLLKRVLLKIVGEGVVPSKELLEASLFGA